MTSKAKYARLFIINLKIYIFNICIVIPLAVVVSFALQPFIIAYIVCFMIKYLFYITNWEKKLEYEIDSMYRSLSTPSNDPA